MKDLRDAVAVVTGGASGIGLALARGALDRGAKVVIADIRVGALEEAASSLGGEVLPVQTDVADPKAMLDLADATIERFGKVNLLFNNAGVFASGRAWNVSVEEYDWVIGVNQRSVINGIHAFVPRMIEQGDPCHVVTISSGAGISVNPGFCSYSMTKHAVLALTEALHLDLAAEGIRSIDVTVVMPGVVQSGIMNPEKTGPAELQPELKTRLKNKNLDQLEAVMRAAVDAGLPASELADQVYRAIANGELYVLPNFGDATSQGIAQTIAIGRATGENGYPKVHPHLYG